MKLEDILALPVNVSSQKDDIDKMDTKTANDIEEASVDITDAAVGEGDEKDSIGPKKKGTRKKRSLNWEETERGLLLSIIKPKIKLVENRSVDAKSIKSKRLAWTQITKQFNAHNFRNRMLEQIQVQWRSMKNFAKREYQQKYSKSDPLDCLRLIEFMEELQNEPTSVRNQTRVVVGSATKKSAIDADEDEDMPLAALPNTTNPIEDTLRSTTIAIPSPPPSTAGGDSQQDAEQQQAPQVRKRKKSRQIANANAVSNCKVAKVAESERSVSNAIKHEQESNSPENFNGEIISEDTLKCNQPALPLTNGRSSPLGVYNATSTTANTNHDKDSKLKCELFKLMKQARLAEMDYARREHEQKLRFEQMELELKLKYSRQEQDLKLRHMREEHEMCIRHQQEEHEARLRAYSHNTNRSKHNAENAVNVKYDIKEETARTTTAKVDFN